MIPSQVEMQDPEDYIYYLKARGLYFIINKTTVLLMIYMYRLRVYLVQKKLNNMVIYTIIYVMYIRLYKDKSISRLYALKATTYTEKMVCRRT